MIGDETLKNVNEDLQTADENSEDITKKLDTDTDENPNADVGDENAPVSDGAVDYAAVVEEDIRILKEEFRELSTLTDICELSDPLRYAALRDLGLTPAEAYLATAKRPKKDNRSHLFATRAVSTSPLGSMSDAELAAAREIFDGVSDSEIRKLYKRVTK